MPYNSLNYISSEFPENMNLEINNDSTPKDKDLIPKIEEENEKYIKSILWNLGILIYELFFGVLPFEKNKVIDLTKIKKSKCKEFDNLISNLLIIEEDKRLKWKEYLEHEFFMSLEPQKVFKILFNKNITNSDREIDLYKNDLDDNNLDILLKIDFKNLMNLNLANNNIENIEITTNNKNSFEKLKILNLEDNKINDVSKNLLKVCSNLEFLFLSHNNIISISTFSDMNLNNLSHLSLSHNSIFNFSSLAKANLINLNILNLSFNKIEDISCLEKMKFPYLEELKLNHNNIDDISIFEKTNFPKLKVLELKYNKIENIGIIKNVHFPELEILNLENNKIENINTLKNVSFNETLKELNLSNNSIKYFEYLHLCYFPSLSKVNLLSFKDDLTDYHLKILSIKLRLYGYDINDQNKDGKISILITPYNLINNSEIWDNKSFDYTNSFKIIAYKNTDEQEIITFCLQHILEMKDYNSKKKLITFKIYNSLLETIDKDAELNNFSILSYIDDNNIIKEKNKINTIYLIKQYKSKNQKIKYHKKPYYIDSITKLSSLPNICPFKNKVEKANYFRNIIDDKELFSSFLKKNDYYNNFPIIFINNKYYDGFIRFLEDSPKYNKFKNQNIFKKLLISSKENYIYKHSNYEYIIAEVVENLDFYSINQVIEIIKDIKFIIEGDYKQIINDWIILIFEMINECFLFTLKIKLFYDICPCCKSPILYTIDNKEKENIINKGSKIIDNTFFKSIQICNNIFNIISQKFNSFSVKDYKTKYFGENFMKNEYIPADPPKKDSNKFINVIYHDENYEKFSGDINEDAIEFRKYTNGTFIFSNCEDSFKLIINGIKNSNQNNNIKFLLITTGSTFEKVYNILDQEKCLELISKACIYCMEKSKHIGKLQKYPNFVQAVYTTQEEVDYFIEENSSENNKIFEVLKLVTYKDYIKEYYTLHNIISQNYKNYSYNLYNESFDTAINLLKDFIEEEKYEVQEEELLSGLKTFRTNDGETIIKEYTKEETEPIYKHLNNWLLNLNDKAYEKAGYFIGELMYKLNEYGMENNLGYKKKETIKLYRGMYINYLDALSYQIHKGKKICFQTFLSTSKEEEQAKIFSNEYETTVDERKKDLKFSILMEIEHNWKEGLYPLCFDIKSISIIPDEEEFLFHPFTFFKIKEFSVDYENYLIKMKLKTINKKEILENKINEGNNRIKYNKEEKLIEVSEILKNDTESESEIDSEN